MAEDKDESQEKTQDPTQRRLEKARDEGKVLSSKEVFVFITHAVLSGDAVKKIKNSKIKKLIITDTIDNSKKIKNNNKIELLSISSLMSEAIKRIANSNSVSDLFN